MGGKKTTVVDTTPKVTQDLRNQLAGYITNQSAGGIGRINAQTPELPQSVAVQGAGPVSTQFNAGGQDPTRNQIRDVTAQNTQSTDQLGGANSAFFNNMVSQLQPSFTQARSEGLAAAKEASGTLTGSGFANRLGSSVNRSLGNEQATLANYAAQGVQMEQARQANDANRNLQAQTSNQGADQTFINQMLARGNQNLQAQQLGLQAQSQNQQTELAQNTLAAQLEAQRRAMGFQTGANVNMQNANNFAQLLGQQATVGAGPTTVQQSGGGFWGTVGGVAGGLVGSALGPIGTAVGSSIGKKIGGG